MAFTAEELYERYLYNNPDDQNLIETISITHSNLTQDFDIVREPDGLTLTIETGEDVYFMGVNFEVSKNTSSDDMDEEFLITFDDTEGVLKDEAELIPLNTTELVKIVYRAFISSDTSEPAFGPITLNGTSMTAGNDGQVTVSAQSPSLVVNRCGELYTYERFPSLKSFL